MPAITHDVIRELAGFRGERAPVTTCYLDVDGRRHLRHQDYEHELDVLLRDAKARADGDASVAADLRRIEDFVKAGIDRSSTRGLAMFSCSAHGLWHVVPLPVAVRNRVVVNHMPAVGQLEAVVQQYDRIGVLLVDRQRARVYVFELGELADHSELFEALPRDYDERGERERGDTQHHVEALAAQHVRHAAAAVWQVFQGHPFDHLLLGVPDETAHAVEAALHPYLRDRVAGRLPVPVTASTDEVRAATLAAEGRLMAARSASAVERLRSAVASGRRGVAGLAAVLESLNARRVDVLLVSQGYEDAGWRCNACAHLATVGRSCPVCREEMDAVADVVEEAVEEALSQSCRVELCDGNADLDVLGRIGALLRY